MAISIRARPAASRFIASLNEPYLRAALDYIFMVVIRFHLAKTSGHFIEYDLISSTNIKSRRLVHEPLTIAANL